ncbi:DUF4412 domain-containing protein [Pollutibacter soli]|uniref:DUF4412 domain-containing protein n=1 Tax=Pollutibacter soli TaxID=3034157 RepID=UPI0030140848
MKTIIALLIFLPVQLLAQNFEGTIVWAVKLDEATKAKMEQANKELSNPANQEKLKQLEEQMNTPEFKAMMDKNPQLKTQMENAKKALGAGNISALIPQGTTIKIKGSNSLVTTQGGTFGTEILTVGAKKQSYRIDRDNKTYTPLSVSDTISKPKGKYTVTKTSETKKILDYNCTKYDVTYVDESGKSVTQHVWSTTEIKGLDMRSIARQASKGNSSFYVEGIDGFPLEIEFISGQGNFGMQVTSLKRENLPASTFEIPAGFTEKR